MIARAILACLVAMKAIVRWLSDTGPVIDIGDLALLAILFVAFPPGYDATFDSMLALPGGEILRPTLFCGLGLLAASRALSASLLIGRPEDLKGVSAGGASRSLARLSLPAACAAAVPFCVPGAMLEELLFRGLLFNLLMASIGTLPALFAQALCFSLLHAVPAILMGHGRRIALYALLFPFVSSIALELLFMSCFSVLPSASVHAFLNFTAVWRSKFGRFAGIP